MRIHTPCLPRLLLLAVACLPGAALAARIVVYGASGHIGAVIVDEALSRGHTVVGVSRHPGTLHFDSPRFSAVAGDVDDVASFRRITAGADAVVFSVAGTVGPAPADGQYLPERTAHAIAARTAVAANTGNASAPYVIEIGGATTLHGNAEQMLQHLPFPAPPGSEMRAMFLGHRVALDTFLASHIRWTVLTPPMMITGLAMGGGPATLERTGRYRTALEEFVKDAAGNSTINVADLAVAAVDEAEHPRHVGQRFTVGY